MMGQNLENSEGGLKSTIELSSAAGVDEKQSKWLVIRDPW